MFVIQVVAAGFTQLQLNQLLQILDNLKENPKDIERVRERVAQQVPISQVHY